LSGCSQWILSAQKGNPVFPIVPSIHSCFPNAVGPQTNPSTVPEVIFARRKSAKRTAAILEHPTAKLDFKKPDKFDK
jgi:hypothetical protein